jgi:hypothetical protein
MTNLPATSLLLALLALCGCSELDNCPDGSHDTEQEPVTTPNRVSDSESGVYSSSPWEGPHVPYPAKTLMRFEHGLETTPELVVSYLSFDREGTDLTENAGNQGRIYCVDNSDIWIKNDTCEEDFYVRVAAWASGTLDTTCTCKDRFQKKCE